MTEEEDPLDLTKPTKYDYPALAPEEASAFHNEVVPDGVTPMEHIDGQVEKAKAEGGIVFDAKFNASAAAAIHLGVPHERILESVGEMHDCTCLDCRSIWLPKEKQGPGHFGSRFGPLDAVIRVFKGEYDTPDAIFLSDVIEVDCDEGWAIRVREPIHICHNCWKGWCVWKDRGEFSVVGIPIPTADVTDVHSTLTTEENLDFPLCSECGHHHGNAAAHGTTTLTQS